LTTRFTSWRGLWIGAASRPPPPGYVEPTPEARERIAELAEGKADLAERPESQIRAEEDLENGIVHRPKPKISSVA
jgi:hypothetical protein